MRNHKIVAACLFAIWAAACSDNGPGVVGPQPDPDTVPTLQREMRGLWIATVANIDWPSSASLSAAQQKAELIDILNRVVAARMNAVILQVRPAADALYESSLEPWGAMLTGTQGTHPGYDPLAFAIEEAHARGLELHAWINPFRAGNSRDTTTLAASHVFKAKRELVRVFGTQIWLDPGDPAAQEHSLRVVTDIATRYDIDAIHADDYFYPYPQTQNGAPLAFPDDATFAQHGGGLARDDWRRANIDRFVQRMYEAVHAVRPTLKVGLSPFGIWRPGNPPGVQGLDAYASIFADSRKWLREGWVDYLSPQLYWAISAPQQSFPSLLDWWLEQNVKGRHVWPGLAAYRVNNGTTSAFSLQEIPNQIALTRARSTRGHLLYNTSWTLKQNGGQLATALGSDVYKDNAVIPASPWLDGSPPAPPSISVANNQLAVTAGTGEAPRWWVVQARVGRNWTTSVHFGTRTSIALPSGTEQLRVYAADAVMNLSTPQDWVRP